MGAWCANVKCAKIVQLTVQLCSAAVQCCSSLAPASENAQDDRNKLPESTCRWTR